MTDDPNTQPPQWARDAAKKAAEEIWHMNIGSVSDIGVCQKAIERSLAKRYAAQQSVDDIWVCNKPLTELSTVITNTTAAHESTVPQGQQQLAVDICRELYDRFVMGGWEPQDAHSQVLAMLAGAAPAPEGKGWIGINSAPMDGSRILIGWWDENKVWQERRAWWNAEFECTYDAETDKTTYRGAWTDNSVVSFGYEEVALYEPTLWMRLPAAPAATETREDGKEGDQPI
jgi:hypothetical protein